MTGIIDIGSNTIRLVMYDKTKQISNIGINSEIISDTENGILSACGIEKLCGQIAFLKEKAGKNEVFAFATYAVRILKNKEEVKEKIFKETGIEIDILSGEKEAEYDFYGLKSTICEKESGIGADLGGGSCQIMIFKEGDVVFSSSYPIGCRKLKNKFVKGKFPDETERNNIHNYIKKELERMGEREISSKKLYMMGGTAKTAAKIYSFINGAENVNVIKTENIEEIIRFIKETPEKVMKNIVKNRYDNIVVGIIIMKEIAQIAGACEIHIKKCGVRDGYLIKKVRNT